MIQPALLALLNDSPQTLDMLVHCRQIDGSDRQMAITLGQSTARATPTGTALTSWYSTRSTEQTTNQQSGRQQTACCADLCMHTRKGKRHRGRSGETLYIRSVHSQKNLQAACCLDQYVHSRQRTYVRTHNGRQDRKPRSKRLQHTGRHMLHAAQTWKYAAGNVRTRSQRAARQKALERRLAACRQALTCCMLHRPARRQHTAAWPCFVSPPVGGAVAAQSPTTTVAGRSERHSASLPCLPAINPSIHQPFHPCMAGI